MSPRLLHPGRREFLQALAGTAVLALPRSAPAQPRSSVSILGERIRLITGAGNNVIAFGGPAATMLVDAGNGPHTVAMYQGAATVITVFNTHYHLESTGGNDQLAAAGAKIVAHLNTKLWMTQEI